ncbi:MAG: uL15 family ribosomal protein [Candidatus Bathyarchaeota archaeon]
MPTRLRKVRKFRGTRSCGWGQSAGHRGAGSHGGFGKTGGHKHGWTYITAKNPDYFGKHGFYHKSVSVTSINLEELDQLADSLLSQGEANKKGEGTLIDLEARGVDKLLGSGKITKPLLVRVKTFSKLADQKIREAKGQILKVE